MITIELGCTTAEDLLCDLGPSTRTYFKEDVRVSIGCYKGSLKFFGYFQDRMAIHSRISDTKESDSTASYFLNYCSLGIDFLLDQKHTVSKMVSVIVY